MRVSGKKNLMKVNVNFVRRVRMHAPLSSQKCHYLYSETLLRFVYGIFMSQFLTIISKQQQEPPARIFPVFGLSYKTF